MLAAAPATMIEKPVVLAIFALTYLGLAVGHVPGVKLDRTGIAILGAIAMMVFAGVDDGGLRQLRQLAHHPAAVRLLRPVGATAAVRSS